MSYLERFRVAPGATVKLGDTDPAATGPHLGGKPAAAAELEGLEKRLAMLQLRLFTENRRALLIVLQGLDASGKDGTVTQILGAMNPLGCRAVAFKAPTATELAHDFLWRVHLRTPERGGVVVFNRSHYEDVLAARVRGLVPKKVWTRRYDLINAFEAGLAEGGTHVLKFFLHISKAEQLKRFKDRLDDPTKQWKVSEADYADRRLWDDYWEAYQDALSRCSTEAAPWFLIPADYKWFRNLAVARIVAEYLGALDMQASKPPADLEHVRALYEAAKAGKS